MFQASAPFRSSYRVAGLDGLRFICAVWVVLHHGARPPVEIWLGLPGIAADWNAIAFDGVAAVIVFFMISGFCVHYPYAKSEPLDLPTFYVHRFVRVGIPLVAVCAFVKLSGGVVGEDVSHASRMVMWSLWCELIYYGLYPALLVGVRKIGMAPIVATAFVAAYLVILSHWRLMTYWDYPVSLAWIAALPAWLLGCAAARLVALGRLPVLPGSIWGWRAAALVLSIPPKALVYASVSPVLIGNPATLGVFALFVFPWLMKEISTYQNRPPPALLEWGGRWSYSLYLTHRIVIVAFTHLGAWSNRPVAWLLQLAAIATVAYGFYRLVERPSHGLARWLAQRLATWQASTGASALRPVLGRTR